MVFTHFRLTRQRRSNETSKLEKLLRRSLKLWIEEKSKFSVNKLSHSGKLQSEGKLDNLFFDA